MRKPWAVPYVLFVVACLSVALALTSGLGHPGDHRSVFFGLDVPEGNATAVAAATASAGCAPTVQSAFVKLDSTSFTTQKLDDIARMGTPFITLEPWSLTSQNGAANQPAYSLAVVADGQYDADLTRIAHVMSALHALVYVRFAHEMNGNWYTWGSGVNGNQAGDYVRAWKHVHDVFARAGATNVRWVWSPDALDTGKPVALRPLYPGDAYVDFVGVTGYGHTNDIATATATLEPTLAEIEMLSTRPVILSEIGADGSRKAEWMASLGDLVKADPRILGFVWFNTTAQLTGATGDYRFNDDPVDGAAFRSMLATANVRCGAP